MSSPLLRELLETVKRAGQLSHKLIKQNAEHLGRNYQQYVPRDPYKAYALVGIPVGLYTGHHLYKAKLNDIKAYHYYPRNLELKHYLGASFCGFFAGTACGALWPIALPASIGYKLSK